MHLALIILVHQRDVIAAHQISRMQIKQRVVIGISVITIREHRPINKHRVVLTDRPLLSGHFDRDNHHGGGDATLGFKPSPTMRPSPPKQNPRPPTLTPHRPKRMNHAGRDTHLGVLGCGRGSGGLARRVTRPPSRARNPRWRSPHRRAPKQTSRCSTPTTSAHWTSVVQRYGKRLREAQHQAFPASPQAATSGVSAGGRRMPGASPSDEPQTPLTRQPTAIRHRDASRDLDPGS